MDLNDQKRSTTPQGDAKQARNVEKFWEKEENRLFLIKPERGSMLFPSPRFSNKPTRSQVDDFGSSSSKRVPKRPNR